MSSEEGTSQCNSALDEDEDNSEFVILNQPPSLVDASLVASHFDMVELQIRSCVSENLDTSPQEVDADLKDLVAGFSVVKDKLEDRNRLLCEELNSFVAQKEELQKINGDLLKMLQKAEQKIQKLQEENERLQNKESVQLTKSSNDCCFEVTCLKQLLEKKSHQAYELPQSYNPKAQVIVPEIVCSATQTPEGGLKYLSHQDAELSNEEGIKNRAIFMETSQRLKDIVQNYNELLASHEAQTFEMEFQSAKFDEARQKEHQLHQEKLDNLTAKLLCVQDQLEVEEHRAHLLKMEINRLEKDVEQIPALKAQVENLRKVSKKSGKKFW